MIEKLNHIGSLLGRSFIISNSKNIENWNGISGDDYDNLFINEIDDEKPTLYFKNELKYLFYFSMSTKIEVFRNDDSVVICNGLLFNSSLEDFKILGIAKVEKLNIEFEIDNELLILDSTIDGTIGRDKLFSSEKFIAIKAPTEKSAYLLEKIELKITDSNEEIDLEGFRMLLVQ